MEKEGPISMTTSSQEWKVMDENRHQQWLLLSAITLALAWGIHRAFVRPKQRTSTTSNDASYRESRLLRHQFGLLLIDEEEHDLKLQVEEEEPDEKTRKITDRNATAIDDAVAEEEPLSVEEETIVPVTEAEEIPMEASSVKDVTDTDTTSDATQVIPSPAGRRRRTSQWDRWQQHRRERVAEAADQRRQQQKQDPLTAFGHWWDVETSLFRIYTLPRVDGCLDDDATTIPPYNPSSKRGHVPILLHVTNDLPNTTITVYWIDFLGKYEKKGSIRSKGGTWRQTTWIDHPWVFCDTETDTPLLHYIPYRVIPNLRDAPTMEHEEGGGEDGIGVHRFHIAPGDDASVPGARRCQVFDPILPFPASRHFTTPRQAAECALRHCRRMQYTEWAVLLQYLDRRIAHPAAPQYRRMRLANPTFGPCVWQTPARGLWLALGFVETTDGYAVWGGSDRDDVDEWALWRHMIQRAADMSADDRDVPQPQGADGYGRAGFGR